VTPPAGGEDPRARALSQADLEQNLRRAVAMAEEARQALEALGEQRAYLQQGARELMVSRAALTALRDARTGDEILVPLGAGHFALAQLARTDAVLAGVGSDVTVETTIADALARIEAELARAKSSEERIVAEQERLAKQYDEIAAHVQDLAPQE